jgi:antirestriction protein
MKLYQVPRYSRIVLQDGTKLFFDHLDGMYSYCTDSDGQVWHISAAKEVTIEEPDEEITTKP